MECKEVKNETHECIKLEGLVRVASQLSVHWLIEINVLPHGTKLILKK